MPNYTIHVRIETDIEVAAESRDEAMGLVAQQEFGRYISPANATVVAVCEDPVNEEPSEDAGEDFDQLTGAPDDNPDAGGTEEIVIDGGETVVPEELEQ